ncbi:MAG: tRNA (adenosine(37)-N6)-threonylcarbamoyltransferase complex dimerization subunit type 1 TsaB [Pseudomonadota bacterium]
MHILALETSMGQCSAALIRIDGASRTSFVRRAEMMRGHAEALMPMVEEVLAEAGLAEAGLQPHTIDTIAATSGPGSFTGVRIAIAAARGLALTTGASLFGTDSLTVLARTALRAGLAPGGPFAICADARRGMIYFGLYDENGVRLDGPLLCAPEEAAQLMPPALMIAAGSGAQLVAEAASALDREIGTAFPNLQPDARALAELASESDQRHAHLRPLYLRPPDAKPQNSALERRR